MTGTAYTPNNANEQQGSALWNARSLEGEKCLRDDINAFIDLCVSDHQWRCQPDFILMSRLRQQSVVTQSQTHLPVSYTHLTLPTIYSV